MFATQEQIIQAMNLDVAGIRRALKNTGYEDDRNEICEVRFLGYSGSSFVYEIAYPDPEDDCMATGHVFVRLKRQVFSKDFDFYADY